MRHGQAEDQFAAHLHDFHRALTPAGLGDAHRMGLALGPGRKPQPRRAVYGEPGEARGGSTPEIILTSEARRAVTTAEQVAGALGVAVKVRPNPRLYDATPETYLAEVQRLPEELSVALVVGHNPGISSLAQRLRSEGELTGSFPPAAAACFEFAIPSWKDIRFRLGNCRWFIKPGELDPAV